MSFYLIRDVVPKALLDDFAIGTDGVCSICRAYGASFTADGRERDLALFRSSTWGAKKPAAVLALSGGKDSLSTLFIVRRVLALPVVALLFDNGHIPRAVVDKARAACVATGTALKVVAAPARWRRRFGDAVQGVRLETPAPCDLCAVSINHELAEVAHALGVTWLILGTNYFSAWSGRPYAVGRRAGSHGETLAEINLPYAMGITLRQARANVRELGVGPLAVPGISSNCLVPHQVSQALAAQLGHIPELEVLALEVIVGHRTRAEALAHLRKKCSPLAPYARVP